MKNLLLSVVVLFLIGGNYGCAAWSTFTATARVGGGTSSIGTGSFVHNLTRAIQRSTGPVLYFHPFESGAPEVTTNMTINLVPRQDGIWFTLNCQCEDPTVKVSEGGKDVPYDRESGRFWIRNTRYGGDPRLIIVEVDCPGEVNWSMPFYVSSSGPLIYPR